MKIKSNENHDFIKKIETYINQRIDQIRSSAKYMNSHQLLSMTLLTVSEELFKTRDELSLVTSHTKEKLARLQENTQTLLKVSEIQASHPNSEKKNGAYRQETIPLL